MIHSTTLGDKAARLAAHARAAATICEQKSAAALQAAGISTLAAEQAEQAMLDYKASLGPRPVHPSVRSAPGQDALTAVVAAQRTWRS